MTRKIPWWVPETGPVEYGLVRDVLESNYLNDGEVTTQFESRISEMVHARHAVAVTSGTAAIYLALAGLGIGPGDEVVVPDITFIATANAVTMTGAKAVLADINPNTLNLCPEALSAVITPRTKAVVPVHISGRAADVEAILKIAAERGIDVIEDAAEAFMSRHAGRCLGTFGKAGCFSFSPNKTITTGQGGVIVTNDDHLHARLRELKDQGRPVRGTGGDDVHSSVGYNFKFTNLQAAVGLGQLTYLYSRMERMKAIYLGYLRGLEGVTGVHLPGFRLEDGERPQWTDALIDRRDVVDVHLSAHNAHCRRFWFPLHTQSPYRASDELFPNASRVGPRALWLPSAFSLTDEDVSSTCTLVRECLLGPGVFTYQDRIQ
jgi:perosamine synthetase